MDKKDIEAIFPLSHQQKGMFLETLLAPASGIHIEQFLWTFQGALNVELFKQAWQSVIQRHGMLRTAFVWKDRPEPLQVTLRSVVMPFELHNLSELTPSEQETRIEDTLRAERQKGFDLSRAPLMRLTLFQTGTTSYQIVWTVHHILMDGWCNQLVLQDLVTYYQALMAGQAVEMVPGPSYRAYVAWLKQQDMLRAEKFWRETLQGITRPTLPGKMSEAEADFDAAGGIYGTRKIYLSVDDTLALTTLSQKQHVTLNTLVQGAWALLLSHYSGDEDVIFGSTVSGRPPTLPGSETTVGLFINTLPLRVKVHPNERLWPWLEKLQAQHLDLRSYEYCSTGQVHQWSNLPGTLPLFESIVVFENYPTIGRTDSKAPGLAGDVQMKDQVGAQTNYALTLLALPGPELELQLVWDQRRFVPGSATRILDHCATLLRSFLSTKETSLSALLDAIPVDQTPCLRSIPGTAGRARSEAAIEAPRTATEQKLASLYEKLFNTEQIGRDDSFFGAGGSSIQALQLVRRVQEAFQVEIPLLAPLEAPTIADLALRIEEAQASAQEAKRNLITPVKRDRKLALSISQQALWTCLQMARPSDMPAQFWKGWTTGRKPGVENLWQEVHPLVIVVRLDGKLNQDALAESLKLLCERHEMLRTRFIVQDGQMLQEIQGNAAQSHLQVLEKPTRSASESDAALLNLVQQEKQRSFDLTGGALWQATLVRLAEQAHALVFTLHPLIADAPSARLILGDLAAFYRGIVSGETAKRPQLPVQYVDYAAWQASTVDKDALQKQLDFWKQSLSDFKPLFPVKNSKNAGEPRTRHATSSSFALASEQVDGMKALGQQESVPWVFTLAAAFQVLLYLCTGEEDIAVALPVPHRPQRDLANVVGPFANYLTLSAFFSGEPSFLDLLKEMRTTVASIFANQDIPFETVAAELALKHSQPAQVMFALDDKPGDMIWSSALTCSDMDLIGNESNFELCLLLQQDDTGLSGRIAYNPKQFDSATIEQFVNDYCAIVANILNAPQNPVSALALGSKP